jgi:hypothetical protein
VKKADVSRRDLGKLALAAFGGALAGSALGAGRLVAAEEQKAKQGLHACCGLNSCKGQGAGGDNECAGMGVGPTVGPHGCAGMNDCAGQGAQYDNACKGQGNCAVPVRGEAWKKARASFEAAMNKAGRQFGAAPASCSG